MTTIDDVHLTRWNFVKAGIPYVHDFGFPTYFREHPEIGSPLGAEVDLGNGIRAQAFTGGVLRFEPGVGVTVVTE